MKANQGKFAINRTGLITGWIQQFSFARSRFTVRGLRCSITGLSAGRTNNMSYYRNVYLKSSDWKSLRLERLEFAKHTCELCGKASPSLDVHHLTYRRLHDVKWGDLRALCRDCHDSVHYLLHKYKKLKTLCRSKQWSVVKRHLAKGIPAQNLQAVCEWRVLQRQAKSKVTRAIRLLLAQRDFSICRNVLVGLRLVKRKRMKWNEKIASLDSSLPSIAKHLSNPIKFLSEYVLVTGIDPRYRADRIGAQKLIANLSSHKPPTS